MVQDFEDYEKLLAIYQEQGEEAYELMLFDEPEKPEGYDDYLMEKEALEYEQHLQMFVDYGADAHARREVGEPVKPKSYDIYKEKKFIYYEYHLKCFDEAIDAYERSVIEEPIKPEGYDEWKAKQGKLQEKKDEFSYIAFVKEVEKQEIEEDKKTEEYLNYDAEGIPEFLTITDYHCGIKNLQWLKKHEPETLKPATHKPNKDEKEGVNYDAEGIPEYLTKEAYHFGEANPEWLAKHEPKK